MLLNKAADKMFSPRDNPMTVSHTV